MALQYGDHDPKSIEKDFLYYKKGDLVYYRTETDRLMSWKIYQFKNFNITLIIYIVTYVRYP
jgi:hypothetical protein